MKVHLNYMRRATTSELTIIYVGWAFLEQLALAAIDVGRLDVADVGDWFHCPFHEPDY